MQEYDSDWDDFGDFDYEESPLYASGELAAMDEAGLQREWERQSRIHDRGVDNLEMGHPTIETAAARLKLVEREQKLRGFEPGPGSNEF